ncbi:MAG TPA: SCO family protein [Pyrinomonadaceae bacterium]|nr:SCO family protein [Pyrinomonadaceae bacterium]
MKSIFERTLIGLALLIGCAAVSFGQVETKRVKTPRERLAERSFPNVTLTTHNGKKVKFYDDLIKDKIVIINFMYVRCDGKCPVTTANLVQVQKLLRDRVGKDIFIYSITLKPEEDTPKVLREYAKAYKVGPGWQFLTGAPKDIELLRQKLGFIDRDPVRDADKSNHIGMLRWGNEPHTLWAGCPASLAPAKIVKELRLVDWPTANEAQVRGGER